MAKFKAGRSGNPKGRPKGALNKVTLAAQALLDDEAEVLTRKALELAMAGNPMALRLCLERLLPPRKDRPINITLPPLKEAKDIPSALGAILAAVAEGAISPGEAQSLTGILDAYRKGLDFTNIEARLTALEERAAHEKS
jgi:hypothetical protein